MIPCRWSSLSPQTASVKWLVLISLLTTWQAHRPTLCLSPAVTARPSASPRHSAAKPSDSWFHCVASFWQGTPILIIESSQLALKPGRNGKPLQKCCTAEVVSPLENPSVKDSNSLGHTRRWKFFSVWCLKSFTHSFCMNSLWCLQTGLSPILKSHRMFDGWCLIDETDH